jgi:hypothetical protein
MCSIAIAAAPVCEWSILVGATANAVQHFQCTAVVSQAVAASCWLSQGPSQQMQSGFGCRGISRVLHLARA